MDRRVSKLFILMPGIFDEECNLSRNFERVIFRDYLSWEKKASLSFECWKYFVQMEFFFITWWQKNWNLLSDHWFIVALRQIEVSRKNNFLANLLEIEEL